ncbi:hypothetical protein EFR01_57870 [Sinorhizobium fredii]|nr:hypothetical protein EFR01_57870 [Sinorhizobium fredii]GLS12505.1 hypothetical protein GCM10007864_61380 [Sinorhizobium fredii]
MQPRHQTHNFDVPSEAATDIPAIYPARVVAPQALTAKHVPLFEFRKSDCETAPKWDPGARRYAIENKEG